MKVKQEKQISQKILITIIIMQILLIPILHTISLATNNISINTRLGTVTIKYPDEKLKVGDEAAIEVYIEESSILAFDTQIKYDKNVFEMKSLEAVAEGWASMEGKETEDGQLITLYTEDEKNAASNTLLGIIHLKVIKCTENALGIVFNNVVICNTDYEDSYDENGKGVTGNITLNLEKGETEKLYLSSETYKIGEKDVENYEEGDKYITEVEEETTKENFIKNLKTNGTIKRVLKSDGTELKEDEIVEDGMILQVTKDDERIELIIKVKEPESEKLYLRSQKYKVGEKDIDIYEEDDVYLDKIEPQTTVGQFIKNCETNGTITVFNQKGEALRENDLVGTNMTIKVTKSDEKMIMTLVVMGDLDGNGEVTPTDLAALNQVILEEVELEGAAFLAADLDDNKEITPTDLATENDTVLEEITLTYKKPSK